jgi:hypothetical protein
MVYKILNFMENVFEWLLKHWVISLLVFLPVMITMLTIIGISNPQLLNNIIIGFCAGIIAIAILNR